MGHGGVEQGGSGGVLHEPVVRVPGGAWTPSCPPQQPRDRRRTYRHLFGETQQPGGHHQHRCYDRFVMILHSSAFRTMLPSKPALETNFIECCQQQKTAPEVLTALTF